MATEGDLHIDLHDGLHCGFEIQFTTIVPVLSEVNVIDFSLWKGMIIREIKVFLSECDESFVLEYVYDSILRTRDALPTYFNNLALIKST